MQFDAFEKRCNGTTIRAFRNCNKWTPMYKAYER